MADPVSWLMIEPGWRVVDADGEEAGRVDAVLGDSNADIFDGLAVVPTILSRPKYLPAEDVAEITDGTVRVALPKAALERLGEYVDPAASFQVEAEEPTREERTEQTLQAPAEQVQPESIGRRVTAWFRRAGRH